MSEIAECSTLKEIEDELFSFIPGMNNPGDLEVLQGDDLSEEEFLRNWVSRNKPCLIKGAIKHWPAIHKWKSQEYWMSNCENFDIDVYPHQNYNCQKRQKRGRQNMVYHEAIKRLFKKEDPIVSMPSKAINSGNEFSEVFKDIGDFKFLKNAKKSFWYEPFRFFSYRQASTAWHVHGVDETLMCQVNGAKKVAILAPDIASPKKVSKYLEKECYLNDDKGINELDQLSPLLVNVEETDALYIPPYWFHAVVPKDDEVGFTLAYCWRSPVHVMGDMSNHFVREIYKQGIWPIKLISPIVPVIAIIASTAFYGRKLVMSLMTKNEVAV